MAPFSSLRSLLPNASRGHVRSRRVRAPRPGIECFAAGTPRRASRRLSGLLVLLSVAVAACAGAPVQEMSNARQAIRAAREAGAQTKAPQTLNEAQVLLNRAEESLERRAYRDARRDAKAARDKAAEALAAAQPARNGTG